MTLLLLLAPTGFSFVLLLSMARYERWALDLDEDHREAEPASAPQPSETVDLVPRPRMVDRRIPVTD